MTIEERTSRVQAIKYIKAQLDIIGKDAYKKMANANADEPGWNMFNHQVAILCRVTAEKCLDELLTLEEKLIKLENK